MTFDVPTLAFVLSLTMVTQVVAIFIQYRADTPYRGIGWWLAGTASMSLGFIVLALGRNEYVRVLSVIGNPLLVLGRICLLLGTLRFLDREEPRRAIGTIFAAFLVLYYYYLFAVDDIALRTVVVSAAIAVYSLLIAHTLLSGPRVGLAVPSGFTGAVFLLHGLFLALIVGDTLLSGPITSFRDYNPLQVAAFIVPTITSSLWTFGFILMVNQRLTSENHEEKENLRQVFNTSPDAALIIRLADGRIVDANSGFSALSGYSQAECVGATTEALSLWCDPAEQGRFVAKIREDRRCENLESTFLRKDGQRVVGLTSARIIAVHHEPHIVSVTRDITEQKRAEEALRESEDTYRSILKASPDDITITDLDGRILLVSPAAYRMFGHGPGEEAGRSLLEFVVPEDRERARANILHMHHGGHQRPNEYRGIRKDGSFVDMEVNSGLIHGAHGQLVKMVFVVRDITERRKAEIDRAALESRNRQLQKAESLGRMAGAIAHHFNNRLQSVIGNLDLVDMAPKGTDPARWLARAREAVERAAEVSRLMLAYLGQASHEQAPRDLAELCRNILPVLQDTLPKGVVMETALPSSGPVVHVDVNQLQQVLASLITNAWEAMGDLGGSIQVSLGTCPGGDLPAAHRFPVTWQPLEVDYAWLEVADTGSGVAPADLEKLFDPFFSTKFTGRGLGLSVVLGIIQAHGGAVTVESRQGRGSTFRIHLPVCAETVPGPARGALQAPEPPPGGTILLVDDDESLLLSTGAALELLGYRLLTARDGVEAIQVFQQHRGTIRCVITDLTMPRMDGWETLAALERLDPALPVILASGYDRAQVMAGVGSVQPRAFLGKPFSLQNLREALGKALRSGEDA
jgi:PAS domain S-box-containing protein